MERITVSLLHGYKHQATYAALVRSIGYLVVAVLASGCQSLTGRDAPTAFNVPTPGQASARNENLPAAESAKLCLATASIMEQNEKHQEAIELYEKARQLDSRAAPQATRCLAVIHDRTGNFDKALDEYRRGIQENPKDAELHNNLGYGYFCRGQLEAAEKQLRKAVSLDAKLASAWTNLGLCLATQSRYDESVAAFEKAVSKAQARCNVGYVQAAQGRIPEARHSYEVALQMEPGLQLARVALQKLGQPSTQVAAQTPQSLVEPGQGDSPREVDVRRLPTNE